MRKITQEAVNAMVFDKEFKKGNTKVWHYNDPSERFVSFMSLHGHIIAKMTDMGSLYITNAGYFTNVTKERLNGFKDLSAGQNVNIVQKEGKWYLNGVQWDGEWISVITCNRLHYTFEQQAQALRWGCLAICSIDCCYCPTNIP